MVLFKSKRVSLNNEQLSFITTRQFTKQRFRELSRPSDFLKIEWIFLQLKLMFLYQLVQNNSKNIRSSQQPFSRHINQKMKYRNKILNQFAGFSWGKDTEALVAWNMLLQFGLHFLMTFSRKIFKRLSVENFIALVWITPMKKPARKQNMLLTLQLLLASDLSCCPRSPPPSHPSWLQMLSYIVIVKALKIVADVKMF